MESENGKTNFFVKILQDNLVQITFAIMGIAGLALGTYISVRLSPLVEDIHSIATRVEAVEKEQIMDNELATDLLPRFYRMEEALNSIKDNQLRLEIKIDKALELQ